MNWLAVLKLIMFVLEKIQDQDGDGRPDIFDKEPENPEVQ